MYKLFLCLRYLRKRRIAFFAVAAVCLCTAMVLIVVSVMGGFLQMVRDRSRGMLGDLIMENASLQGFPFYQEFIDLMKAELPDRIEEATPVIISYGVIRFPTDQITKPAQIVGIRLAETMRVNEFGKGLFYETYYPGTTTLGPVRMPCVGFDEAGRPALPEDLESAWQRWRSSASPAQVAKAPIEESLRYGRPGYYAPVPAEESGGPMAPGWYGRELPGAIIGTDLCARREPDGSFTRYYWRGYPVTLTFVPFTDTGKPLETGSGMPSKLFRYVDDCRTGVYDIDSMSVYVDFDLLQDVLEMDEQRLSEKAGGGTIPPRTTQVQIKLRPGVDPRQTRDLLVQRWQEFYVSRIEGLRTPELIRRVMILTWEEKQAKFIGAVEKEKVLVTTLFGVISVVAVFLVGVIFHMIVQQKTRDIGIIRSVGATSLGVAQIFIAYGAAVGVIGGALGTALGTAFVWRINEFQDFLRWLDPRLEVWNAEVYAFDRIPNTVQAWDAGVIYVVAVLASIAGSLVAARRAARVWPVEALRYE